jgi:hypothetical protein
MPEHTGINTKIDRKLIVAVNNIVAELDIPLPFFEAIVQHKHSFAS